MVDLLASPNTTAAHLGKQARLAAKQQRGTNSAVNGEPPPPVQHERAPIRVLHTVESTQQAHSSRSRIDEIIYTLKQEMDTFGDPEKIPKGSELEEYEQLRITLRKQLQKKREGLMLETDDALVSHMKRARVASHNA